MRFNKGGKNYTVLDTGDVTTDGQRIFKFTVWQGYRIVDTGMLYATDMNEAKAMLKERDVK